MTPPEQPAPDSGRRGRPALAALFSTFLPGAGQWFAGRRRRGLLLLALAGAGLGGTLWLVAQGQRYLLRTFLQPRWLWVLLGANLVILAVRAFAVGDAYALERRLRPGPQAGRGWPARGMLALLLVGVVAPHGWLAYDGLVAIHTLSSVAEQPPLTAEELREQGYGEEDFGPVTSTTSSTTTLAVVSDAADWLKNPVIPDDDLNPVRPVITPREPSPFDVSFLPLGERLEKDRITILLAGGDAGPGRWSLRTDVMIVATMSIETGKAVLFSVSRDMINPPLPSGWKNSFTDMQYDLAVKEAKEAGVEPPAREGFESCGCFPDRINGIYTFTHPWITTFPLAADPGMEALRQTLSLLLGLNIDYYVLVDMAGFVDLVDAMGGLDLYITETMDVGFSPAKEGEDPVVVTIVEPGNYHLDGHQALAFVRNRTNTNDAARMRRQRCTLRALAAEIEPTTLLLRFDQIARAIRESTATNVPLNFLPDLVDYAAALDYDDIATIVFGNPYYAPELDFRGLPIVDPERIQHRVQTALVEVETAEGLEGLSEPCEVLPAR
jgi:LCP family protein required for cell wall assembly